jgi:predicted DNA-binding protein (UPF0251 family)
MLLFAIVYLFSKAFKDTEFMKKQKRSTSVPLTKAELQALKEYRKEFVTEVQCAIEIGIDRNVLNRIISFGSGSPDSIEKIRAALKKGVTTN